LNVAKDKKLTVGGNELQTFMIRSTAGGDTSVLVLLRVGGETGLRGLRTTMRRVGAVNSYDSRRSSASPVYAARTYHQNNAPR